MTGLRTAAVLVFCWSAALALVGCSPGETTATTTTIAGTSSTTLATAVVLPPLPTIKRPTFCESLAVMSDGSLMVWGVDSAEHNSFYPTSPTRVGFDSDWVAAARGDGTFAIKSDGSLWLYRAPLRTGYVFGITTTTFDPSLPIQVGSDSDWEAVAADGRYALALKSDGTLWAWGEGMYGELGLGEVDSCDTPTRVGLDSNWTAVAVCNCRSLALKSDGTLWAWGANDWGQLGLGDTIGRDTPTRVGSDGDWAAVAAGGDSSLALKSDGSLWAWGQEVVDSRGVAHPIPTRIGTDNDWAAVAAGNASFLALKSDGSLWNWGRAPMLGEDVRTHSTLLDSPTRVGADNDWVAVSAGMVQMALKSDGSLWGWDWPHDPSNLLAPPIPTRFLEGVCLP